jgi:hypothetical protein
MLLDENQRNAHHAEQNSSISLDSNVAASFTRQC